MNFRPQASTGPSAGGDISSTPATGTHELSGASLSANVQGQFTSPIDAAGAPSFYTPESSASLFSEAFSSPYDVASTQATVGSGVESLNLAQNPVLGTGLEAQALANPAGMPGSEAVLAHMMGGANEPISPIIQMIMRMPGAMGLFNSFFEFFSNFFLNQTSFFDLLNPAFLGAQAYTALSHTIHHAPFSLSILPSSAPIFHSLNGIGSPMFSTSDMLSAKLNLSLGQAGSTGFNPTSMSSFKTNFNVSGGLDLNKPIYEGVPSQAGSGAKGVLSGPGLTDAGASNHLAGNTRLFSDKIAGNNISARLSSSSSTASTSVTGNSGLNIASNNSNFNGFLGTPQSSVNQTLIPEELIGKTGSVEPAGFNYGGEGSLNAGNSGLGPSGAVSNELGSKSLLAMDSKQSFQPTISETGERLQSALDGGNNDIIASGGQVGLKAKQLTLEPLKPAKAATSASSSGHAASSASTPVHKAASHAPANKAPNHHPKVSHKISNKAESAPRVEASPDVSDHQLIAEAQPAVDATSYTIQPGDNLWNIARDRFGDGLKWHDIYDMNSNVLGSNPDLIYPGTTIDLPGQMGEIAQNGATNYVVQPGDNLWDISKNLTGEGHNWGDIYNMNRDAIGANPSLIHPGQQLNLPGNDPGASALSSAGTGQTSTPLATETTSAPDLAGEHSLTETVGEPLDSGSVPNQSMGDVQEGPVNNEISYEFEQDGSSSGFQATVSQAPQPTGLPVIPANAHPVAGGPGAAHAATISSGNKTVVSTSGLFGDLGSLITGKKGS